MGSYDSELTNDQILYLHEQAAVRRQIWRHHREQAVDAKKRTLALVAEVDPAELAVRIIEASGNMKRPPGTTAAQALDGLEEGERQAALRAANAAAAYIRDCINAGQQPG